MKEIVGAKIGTKITNDPKIIMKALDQAKDIQWLERAHMKLMSSCDLGQHWDNMANGETLFKMTDNDELIKSND
ncbi:MAG: hypothetical protein OEX12_05760 [Gammaproteobacteria bacterium]|nr:hypothetical protein [Gammaproteobacteria bacterium]